MTILFRETDIESWSLPHVQDRPNDAGPLSKAGWDDAIAANREMVAEVEAAYSSQWPEPGCTPEQQQAAREVMDWLAERPELCAAVAVAAVAVAALVSSYFPMGFAP